MTKVGTSNQDRTISLKAALRSYINKQNTLNTKTNCESVLYPILPDFGKYISFFSEGPQPFPFFPSVRILDVDGRIILRWIFRKLEGVVGTGWSWLRIGTVGGHLWVR